MTLTIVQRTQANISTAPGWTAIFSVAILVRAFVVALVLGSVLTAINQPEALFDASSLELLPFALVYITPFAVVTISQVLGIRQAQRDGTPLAADEGFPATMLGHGIPTRSILTGLLVGTVNTSITVATALIETGGLGDIPVPLLVQAYSLPVLFGLLSQAISYRRAKKRLAEALA
jgi:ABC-type transport system involved in multi-copper enzyme maturation permease subunit